MKTSKSYFKRYIGESESSKKERNYARVDKRKYKIMKGVYPYLKVIIVLDLSVNFCVLIGSDMSSRSAMEKVREERHHDSQVKPPPTRILFQLFQVSIFFFRFLSKII